jgi:CPA2 family monovalent cation:H+ antiporter-2
VLVSIVGLVLSKIKQPYIIGYILIGALTGKDGLGLIENPDLMHYMGEIGIVLLLFFIGMEINLRDIVSKWRLSLLGTIIQVLISVAVALLLGYFMGWSVELAVVIGFVIALSSTAVSIRLLEDKGLFHTRIGNNVLSVLLAQDVIIVPLLIITSFLGGSSRSTTEYFLLLAGGVFVVLVLVVLFNRKTVMLPFSKRIMRERELQVFVAILFCFGGALVTSLFGLSAALGAFVGGIVINSARATGWIQGTLHSFRVLFVAIFFISIGLQLDLHFLWNNALVLSGALLAVFVLNQFINSAILRFFGSSRKESLLGGSYLAQIGELSFLIAATAFNLGIKSTYAYNFTISLISLTLIISPFWIYLVSQFVKRIDAEQSSSDIS